MNDLKKLSEPLKDSDIELRVGNVFQYGGNKYGMSLLAYKTARVDSARLDDVVGPLNWKNEYFYDAKNILCCRIAISTFRCHLHMPYPVVSQFFHRCIRVAVV